MEEDKVPQCKSKCKAEARYISENWMKAREHNEELISWILNMIYYLRASDSLGST